MGVVVYKLFLVGTNDAKGFSVLISKKNKTRFRKTKKRRDFEIVFETHYAVSTFGPN